MSRSTFLRKPIRCGGKLIGLIGLTGALAVPSTAFARSGLIVHVSHARHPATSSLRARAADYTQDGFTPADLHRVYGLPFDSPRPQTVAVVVAYDSPTIAQDLAAFSNAMGIPGCGTQNGCFRKVNERGDAAPLPDPDTSGQWVSEAVLGTQTVHGICRNCRILLVEADTQLTADLATAVDTAVRLGATEIATSYSPGESSLDLQDESHYKHPGVVITAAAGDFGWSFGAAFPAVLPSVVAVGGTELALTRTGAYGGEKVWNAADGSGGSGCSLVFPAPSWQASEAQAAGCGAMRATADVAAVADPGALVYSSTPLDDTGYTGWYQISGTSFSSPLIAATYALAGGVPRGVEPGQLLYSRAHARRGILRDITQGSNGNCPQRLACQAGPGWDGPTGVGTPLGLGAFAFKPPAPPASLDPRKPRVSLSNRNGVVNVDSRGRARIAVSNSNGIPLTIRLSARFLGLGSIAVPGHSRRVITMQLSRHDLRVLRSRRAARVRLSIEAIDVWDVIANLRPRVLLVA